MTERSSADAFATLPTDLPPGRLVSADGNCVSVAAPPRPDEASRLALEHCLACPDNIYQDESVVFATYAERLVSAPIWSFWWD